MVVIGGAAHIPGAIVGAGIVQVLNEQLQAILPRLFGPSGSFEVIVFGTLLVVLLQFARDGLWPALARLLPEGPFPSSSSAVAPLTRRAIPDRGKPVLEVVALQKSFGGLVAVKDVTFSARAGEIVGLIGPNGAGKTTIFNLITGILTPTAGEVCLLGSSIGGLPARVIATLGVARTFQHVKLLPTMSVLDNVMIGGHLRGTANFARSLFRLQRTEEARLRREAIHNLDRCGLGESLHLPAGSLALGQSRIVEIARCLCLDPVLILLDEPAAGLRHGEKQALAKLLRRLCDEGITILLVEHNMDLVMGLVDRLVVVDFGEKIAEGSPKEVYENPVVLEAYLGGVE